MINFLPKLRPHFNKLLEPFLKDKFENNLNFLHKNDKYLLFKK